MKIPPGEKFHQVQLHHLILHYAPLQKHCLHLMPGPGGTAAPGGFSTLRWDLQPKPWLLPYVTGLLAVQANRTGEELLRNPSQRPRHQDRQQRSSSSTGKHLAALSCSGGLSLEKGGEMKAARCKAGSCKGHRSPSLHAQGATFLERRQGGVTCSKKHPGDHKPAWLISGVIVGDPWMPPRSPHHPVWALIHRSGHLHQKKERQDELALEISPGAPPF